MANSVTILQVNGVNIPIDRDEIVGVTGTTFRVNGNYLAGAFVKREAVSQARVRCITLGSNGTPQSSADTSPLIADGTTRPWPAMGDLQVNSPPLGEDFVLLSAHLLDNANPTTPLCG